MTMTYQPRDNRRKKARRRIRFGILSIIVVIVIVLDIFSPHAFSPLAHASGLPFMQSRNFFSDTVNGLWEILHSKRELVAKNLELNDELQKLSALEAEKKSLEEENKSLKSLLGRGEPKHEIIWARIISKPGFSPYDTLIVDVGSSEGVDVGDLVVVDESAIIGEVSSVYAHSSNILLYSSPEQKVDIFIGSKALQTTAEGKGGGNFEVRLPRNADVKIGDIITMSQYPDYVFGSVLSINDSTTDSYMRILFRSIADISSLRYVTIQKKPY